MPYTPPAYNAVDFDFTGPPYSPPASTAVVFNFGGSGPPPPQDQLPTARKMNYQLNLFEETWMPRRARNIAFIPTRRRRPVLFTVT